LELSAPKTSNHWKKWAQNGPSGVPGGI